MPPKRPISAANHSDLQHVAGSKVLLGGQNVFVTTNPSRSQPKFVKQKAREAVGGILGLFGKNAPKVHVQVDPAVFEVPNFSKVRFAFCIDGYLSWGLRQGRGITAIIGGIEASDTEFNVHVLVFQAGRLLSLQEKEIQPRSSARFRSAAQAVVEDIRTAHPNAKIVQAAPLSDWQIDGVEYVADKPLKRLVYRPLSKSETSRTDYLIAGTIATAGLFFYCGAVAFQWNKFVAAQDRFTTAAANPAIKSQGGIDTSYLATLEQRRLYMDTPRRQDLLPAKALEIVKGIGALPAVQIIEMKLPAPGLTAAAPAEATAIISPPGQDNKTIDPNRVPDVLVSISVPRSAAAALYQGEEVARNVGINTGMSVRVIHQGWQDVDQNRRIFKLEGFIHG